MIHTHTTVFLQGPGLVHKRIYRHACHHVNREKEANSSTTKFAEMIRKKPLVLIAILSLNLIGHPIHCI